MRWRRQQHGIALLLLLFLTAIVAATVVIFAWNSSRARMEQEKNTHFALQQAREALIGFAASHPTKPGYLPCPENTAKIGTPLEGDALGSCSGAQLIGRLPWRTLGLDHRPDGWGEPLWYVLSTGIQTSPINSNSVPQIELDGIPNAAVALIISPGPSLSTQNRTPPTETNPPDPAEYLDLGNITGPHYQSNGLSGTFNDIVLPITHDQLFRPVEARVVKDVRIALEQYFEAYSYYPSPALFTDATCLGTSNNSLCPNASTCSPLVCTGRIPATPGGAAAFWPTTPPNLSVLRGTTGITPDWFQRNGWRELIHYAVSPSCIEGSSGCTIGSIKILNPAATPLSGLKVVVIAAGSRLSNQYRTTVADKTLLSNYLEDENISPLDNIFTRTTTSTTTPFNDQLAW